MPKINVSFKERYDELKMYDEVLKHSDKSAFMKEALEYYLKQKNTPVKTEDRFRP